MIKKDTKKIHNIYIKNFIIIIVIPILSIGIMAMFMLIRESSNAIDANMELVEKNILDTLENEINDSSLQFSRFLLTNNNQVLDTVALYNIYDGDKQYMYEQLLKNQFNLLVLPKLELAGIQFYMKGEREYYFKNSIELPRNEIKNTKWYKNALEQQDKIHVNVENKSIISNNGSSNNKEKILVLSISPDKYDIFNQIEMGIMYVKSNALNVIESANSWSDHISVYLVDENQTVLAKSDERFEEEILSNSYLKKGKLGGNKYNITKIKNTNWRLVIISRTNFITEEFKLFFLLIVVCISVVFSLFYIFSIKFLGNIVNPLGKLAEVMEKSNISKASVTVEKNVPYEIQVIQGTFNKMVLRIRQLILENEKKEIEKHKEELRALQFQMNPHFLSNTLSTIRFMAQVAKYDGIRKMTESLIQILDCSFRSNESFHTLYEEVEMLNSYLYIMGMRYVNNFEIEFQIDKDCQQCLIPKLILQPLFENSIVHGFDEKQDIGHIVFKVFKEKNYIKIHITDDGKGMSEKEIEDILIKRNENSNKIGIINIYNRLGLYYEQQFNFIISSKIQEYTKVEIVFPYKLRNKENKNV
ncbi:sensor histidine kinase [Clostridium grantii]|uniref:Two-component system, sensor histidine kinase YesM n=1 Tax=Clostridium grantii DSM 8605 TaxID=1121316 RepID=A0A1M5VEM8_9CLOT|nr:histidine kinase [Clostridium grantii]SHH73564.1 two-component system, sensor histidine kinase YesM [Clostridium grantii DSM 8605]